GVTEVRATSEGVTDVAQVTVALPGVSRVELSPKSATLKVGDSQQFSATAYDSKDNVLSGRSVQWGIEPTSVATVSTSGRVTAVSSGTALLTATIEGRETTALVTVSAPGVASVRISPTSATLDIGDTEQ